MPNKNTDIELKPFNNYNSSNNKVVVDWEYAMKVVKNIDNLAHQEGRRAISGKPAINILAEYGLIAYDSASPPEDSRLAIFICPPFVHFCPSMDGLNGVFIQEYNAEKHGKCFLELKKEGLFDYTNIDSRLDGWSFFSSIISLSWGLNAGESFSERNFI